jgi:transcriptional regulator with XRE-family HTH domain
VKLSDLRSADEIHEQDMLNPAYKQEYERTKFANDVALKVLAYRTEHGMSQTKLARKLGMRQPNIARLESGEHEPTLSTLRRLSLLIGLDFSMESGEVTFRKPPAARKKPSPRKAPKSGIVLTKLAAKAAKAAQAKEPKPRRSHTLAAKVRAYPGSTGSQKDITGRSDSALPAGGPG